MLLDFSHIYTIIVTLNANDLPVVLMLDISRLHEKCASEMPSRTMLTIIRRFYKLLIALLAFGCCSSAFSESSNPVEGSEYIVGEQNFLYDYQAINDESMINVVVEIPAGTNQKWEVSRNGKFIHWELKNGIPRVVNYLPYLGNYGMVPRTKLPKELGGDGDPLDVILLSQSEERGRVVAAHPIGLLLLLDKGERDDKILAVPIDGPLSNVRSMRSLQELYPGVAESIEIWFNNYKSGKTHSEGFGDRDTAWKLIRSASEAFERGIDKSHAN